MCRIPIIGLVLVVFAAALAAPAPPLAIDVRAREIAAGEPLRVVVRAGEPLATLEGSFADIPFALVPVDPAPDGSARTWTGWVPVPLDTKARRGLVRVSGRSAAGEPVAGAHAVRLARRVFKEERLTVAPRYVEPPADELERIHREQELSRAIYARRTPLVASGPFVRPVPGEASAPFGTRRIFNGEPRAPHAGIDLRAATGTPVRAAGPARVAFAGDLYFSGGTVILDHGAGLFTIYAHLSRVDVAEGATVAAGQAIGLSGATGRVTGPHLHWGARVGAHIVDPRALLDPALWEAS